MQLLDRFDATTKHSIIMELGKLSEIPLEGIVNVAQELKNKVSFLPGPKEFTRGGAKSIATLLNQMSIEESEQYLHQIEQDDPELYSEVKKFFLSFESTGLSTNLPIQLEAKVNEYLSLIMRLIFAFGISFQLPILLNLLARIGVVNSDYLKKRRRYVIVIIFAMAAILTPPDPITQVGLAIPLLLLYELSIFTVKFTENKKEKKALKDA